jgi:hypothetical protein
MPCPSRRSLRQDEAFDKLIDVVFPDRTVLQKHNEEVMARLRQTTNMGALAESVKFGMKVRSGGTSWRWLGAECAQLASSKKEQRRPHLPLPKSNHAP